MSLSEATLLWFGLETKTRHNYRVAKRSYEFYCACHGLTAWPASRRNLEKWVALRAFGSRLPLQAQISFKTIQSYLSALRSVHIDNDWPVEVFENKRLRRIIKGAARMFPHLKKQRFPITRDILLKITKRTPPNLRELNLNTAFIIAWAGFLRCGEFTYSSQDREDALFVQTHLTRSDSTFEDRCQYAILRLKFSKTDYDHTGVEIILAATGDELCPVAALRNLFQKDPQHQLSPLFNLDGAAFARKAVVDYLCQRLRENNMSDEGFSGHSFRKGAAQHAADNGMLAERIQKLGRWSSDAFKLYFKDSVKSLYNLSFRFQKGRAAHV